MNKVIAFLNDHQFLSYRVNEPMKKHTYMKVGGEADVLFIPEDKDQLITTLKFLISEKIPYKVIGNGSNLLFSDQRFEGVIIKNTKALNHVEIEGDGVIAGSSLMLVKLAIELQRQGLSGLEFVHGIPGTVGGALYMNAGAYNREMKDALLWVKVIDQEGEVKTLTVDECVYSYRNSIFKSSRPDLLILEGKFKLEHKDPEEIKELMNRRKERRTEAQPLEYPSCGSVFKNPLGTHAYIFIDRAGLRGYRIGGAKFSDKHCNFIINDQGATAADVKALIDLAEEKVFETSGIELQREVEYFNF